MSIDKYLELEDIKVIKANGFKSIKILEDEDYYGCNVFRLIDEEDCEIEYVLCTNNGNNIDVSSVINRYIEEFIIPEIEEQKKEYEKENKLPFGVTLEVLDSTSLYWSYSDEYENHLFPYIKEDKGLIKLDRLYELRRIDY